ncbi:MAG: hypothetical protein ABR915_17350 [Thermoguttaceae bacterium]|jgi:hypothetical protein
MNFHFRMHPWRRWAGPRCGLTPAALAAAVMVLAVAGCGKGHGDRAAVYRAEGQVLWEGKPLEGAMVAFYPEGQSKPKNVPWARTDAEGRFQLSTYDPADGAPEGEYAVTVVHNPLKKTGDGWSPGPNVLPAKYASPKTTNLKVQVVKGANTLPALALQP